MNHTARATQRKPHGKGAKPRPMVAHPKRRQTPTSPAHAEGLALRTAQRLCADSARAEVRAQHRTYIDGFIAALQSVGVLADRRAIVLRNACHQLLDGQITLGDYDAMTATADINPGYVRAVQCVRRARSATPSSLAEALNIGTAQARQHLADMVLAGMLNDADMFGVHTVRGEAVTHD